MGLIKNKGREDYFIFHEKRDFFISYNNQALGGNLIMGMPFFDSPKRSSLLQFGKKGIYLCTQLKGELSDLF